MSISANFTRSYKIPRRQTATGTSSEANKNQPNTLSPLTKNVNSSKNRGASSSNVKQHSRPAKTSQQPSTSQARPKLQVNHSRNAAQRRKDPHHNETAAKQKILKRKLVDPGCTARKHHCSHNDDPLGLLDRIWKEMDEDDNRRRKSDEQQQDSSMSPTGMPFIQASTPMPSTFTIKLTRHELLNVPRDDPMFRTFLSKPGLMERILGYKMLHSRVDSYDVMKKPAKLEECEKPDDEDVDYGVPPFEFAASTSSTVNAAARGPKTPPGSPNHEPDDTGLSTEEWHSRSLHSAPSSHHSQRAKPKSRTHTPQPLDDSNEKEFSSRAELLQTFSQATNTPVEKLEELIGADLQHAIGRVAKSVLLNTLKDAIRNVSSLPSSSKPAQLNRVIDSEKAVDSPVLTNNCGMECSSTDSNASSRKSPLLPPPPVPPTKKISQPLSSATLSSVAPPPIYRPASSTLVNPSRSFPPMRQPRGTFNPRLRPPIPVQKSMPIKSPTSIIPPAFAGPISPCVNQIFHQPPPVGHIIDTSRPPPMIPNLRNPMPSGSAMFTTPPPRAPTIFSQPVFRRPTFQYSTPPIYNRPPPVRRPMLGGGGLMRPPPRFAESLNPPEQTVFKTLISALGSQEHQPSVQQPPPNFRPQSMRRS